MSKDIDKLALQPGEASWASFKCQGGVHKKDSIDTINSVRTVEQIYRLGAVTLSYAGTETSIDEKPVIPSVRVQYTRRAFLPA